MIRLLAILFIIFAFCWSVNSQTREQVLNQQLNKTLDVIEAQDKLIDAQKAEILALKRSEALAIELADARKAQSEAKDEELERKDAQIVALRKISCDTTSFFWGLIKKKTCR